jgi:outer membrane protein TolC
MRANIGRVGVALTVAFFLPAGAGAQESVGQGRVIELSEAVGLALRNNRDIRDALLAREAADGRVKEAWGSVMPTLDLTASYTRNLAVPANFLPRVIFDPDAGPDELVAVKFGADNAWNFQLRAEQPLFQAAAFIGVGAAARYQALQTEVVRGRAIDVTTRVKVAYYDALLAQESVRLSENTVRRIRQTLEETQAMNRAGISSSYDVLRLEVELANVEPGLRRSRNAFSAATRALSIELGLREMDSLAVAGSLASFDIAAAAEPEAGPGSAAAKMVVAAAPATLSEARALELARGNRSDLRQLDLTERLRETELKVERSEYLPKLTLFGTYSINAQQNGSPDFFGSSGEERAFGRQVGLQVSVPLFAGFKRPARLSQLRAGVEQVRTQRHLLEDRVENEVKTVLEQVEEARSRATAQRLALTQAQRGFEIASVQYREGISSQLEVTDAEVALRQSEFNYAEAVYDYLVARARLDQSLGMVPLDGLESIGLGETRDNDR